MKTVKFCLSQEYSRKPLYYMLGTSDQFKDNGFGHEYVLASEAESELAALRARIAELEAEINELQKELDENITTHAMNLAEKLRLQLRSNAELEAKIAALIEASENLVTLSANNLGVGSDDFGKVWKAIAAAKETK